MALSGSNAAIVKLQGVLTKLGLDSVGLPQIAVVGAQSSGKSSVLEAIVGKDFLPRGTGIVTRRPLVLQLEQSAGDEFAEFGHRPGNRLPLGDAVRNEIQAATDRECGSDGKAVSDNPIVLRIFSPNVMNLTLVDLPGVTRVRMDNQPANIVTEIRKLVFKYIEKESCLILAVTPANQDLANSDALQMAKMVDPRGQRTIGVLTKVDLMDKGTDAVDVLMGRVLPFKHGIFGVVNRSQQEIEAGKTIKDALKKEVDYFAEHPAYKTLHVKQGSTCLAKNLSGLLSRHVRAFIPSLRNEILTTMSMLRTSLDAYGGEEAVRAELERDQGSVLLQMLSAFAEEVIASLNGRHVESADPDAELEVVGGARINWIFHEMYQDTIAKVMVKIAPEDIKVTMRNMSGIGGSAYAAHEAFEVLIKGQIQRLEAPSLECVELVQQELYKAVEDASKLELSRFPELGRACVDKSRAMIAEATVPLAAFIRNLIKREMAYVNTQNQEFIRVSADLCARPAAEQPKTAKEELAQEKSWFSWGDEKKKLPEKVATPQERAAPAPKKDRGGKVVLGGLPSSLDLPENATDAQREKAQVGLVQNLCKAYFRVVKKNLLDGVPKAAMYFLVNRIKANLQKQLLHEMYTDYTFTRLMNESEESVEIRKRAIESMGLLKEAIGVMDEVKRDVA